MNKIILLGLRAQIDQRNEAVDGLTRLLNEMRIFPSGIDDIITQYIYREPMRIDPAMGDRFWNRKYSASCGRISFTLEVVGETSGCSHSCCKSGPYLECLYQLNGEDHKDINGIDNAWNYMLDGYNNDFVTWITEWILFYSKEEFGCKYKSLRKVVKHILDSIRMQILAPDDKKM